jgi:hypothetical protein
MTSIRASIANGRNVVDVRDCEHRRRLADCSCALLRLVAWRRHSRTGEADRVLDASTCCMNQLRSEPVRRLAGRAQYRLRRGAHLVAVHLRAAHDGQHRQVGPTGGAMSLPKRDVMATVLVAVAGVLFWLWAADSAPSSLKSVRATGLVILTLGFGASASAVIPGFERLLHGNGLYLAVTSAIGLVALAAGVWVLLASSEAGLAVLMGAMAALWLIATVHHGVLAGEAASRGRPGPTRRQPRPA